MEPGAGIGGGKTDEEIVRLLTARVYRLEQELGALQREMDGLRGGDPAARPSAAYEARPAPPPWPVQTPMADVDASVPGLVPGERGDGAAPKVVAPIEVRESFENRLGSQIFNRIGIVLLLIGTAWFLKLAIDRQWIGPVGRVLTGLAAGAGLVLWSESFRAKGFAAFSYSLKALGSGVLYLTLWAAFQLYHLLPAPVALALMVLVTAWNAYMAWAQDSELLAGYALAGGFATPMLLSTGGNHEVFLFTYLLAIDVAIVALVRLRRWPRLLLAAFPLTMVYFVGWYSEFFTASEMAVTAVFIVFFDCTFSSVPVGRSPEPVETKPRRGWRDDRTLVQDVMLPLANAAFLSLALYSVLQDSGHHDLVPWLMILLAAVYLAFMRLPLSRTASAIHLSIAVVFLTIAIPLKASGHWITVGWLGEGLALMWVAARLGTEGSNDAGETYASRTLRWLATAALGLGFCAVILQEAAPGRAVTQPFFNADFATALAGLGIFAGVVWVALGARAADFWTRCAATATVAFNLIAVLTGVREIAAVWQFHRGAWVVNTEASLQQALAISAFLMVYGAALLAVGFWRRVAFLRWQALVLLVFTIFKAFLYDMRNLSQGYRVVSFLALGALLMTISFAYQKDWLGLRETGGPTSPEAAP